MNECEKEFVEESSGIIETDTTALLPLIRNLLTSQRQKMGEMLPKPFEVPTNSLAQYAEREKMGFNACLAQVKELFANDNQDEKK